MKSRVDKQNEIYGLALVLWFNFIANDTVYWEMFEIGAI